MFVIYLILGCLLTAFLLAVFIRASKNENRSLHPERWPSILDSRSQVQTTLRELRQQAEASPQDPAKWLAFFVWLDKINRNDIAEELLRQAVDQWPDNPDLLVQFAWVVVDRHPDSPECLDAISRAEVAGGQKEFLSDTKAWRLYRLGNPQAAWTELASGALDLVEDVPDIASHAAFIRDSLGDYRKALKYAEIALSLSDLFHGSEDTKKLLRKLTSYDEIGE